jgi:hypothetical protein
VSFRTGFWTLFSHFQVGFAPGRRCPANHRFLDVTASYKYLAEGLDEYLQIYKIILRRRDMQKIKISAWGNSLGFRIPRGIADSFNIQP